MEQELRCYKLTVRASRVFVCHSPLSCCLVYFHHIIDAALQTKMPGETEMGNKEGRPSIESRERRAQAFAAGHVGTVLATTAYANCMVASYKAGQASATSVSTGTGVGPANEYCGTQYVSAVGDNQPVNAYQAMGNGPAWGQPSASPQVGTVFVVSTLHRRVCRHLITNLGPCNSVPCLEADVRPGHHPQTAQARLRSRSEDRLPEAPLASFSPRRRYAYTFTKLVS